MLLFRRTLALLMVLAAAAHANSPATGVKQADSLGRVVNQRVLAAMRAHGSTPSEEPAKRAPTSTGRGVAATATPHQAPGDAPPAAGEHGVPDSHGVSAVASDTWSSLLEGNERFAEGKPRRRQLVNERRALIAGQHPRAIVLACSDSRCSPELVFDQSLGELFVIRTAGNVADAVALGSIEYAAEHLHVPLLIVLGHSSCGAVTATLTGGAIASANLRAIVELIRPAAEMAKLRWRDEALLPHAIEGNVQQSARDLLMRSAVLRDAAAKGELRIVTAVYTFETGEVTPLP